MSSELLLYSILLIALISGLTFLARFFPFLLFSRGGKAPPSLVIYLGEVLPPAVMMLLIVYCLRNIDLTVYPYGLPELAAIVVVVILYKLTKNNLIAMVSGTALYMVLLQVVV